MCYLPIQPTSTSRLWYQPFVDERAQPPLLLLSGVCSWRLTVDSGEMYSKRPHELQFIKDLFHSSQATCRSSSVPTVDMSLVCQPPSS